MSTIYITSDWGKLVKNADTLQLKKGNDTLKTIFPFKTEQIVIIGEIEITSAALKFLMHHNIDTIFLGKSGKFNGKITFQASKNVFLRQRQFQMLAYPQFKLKTAKAIVIGKLKNQLTFMQRIKRTKLSGAGYIKTIEEMKINLSKALEAENIESLMGYEGNGAKLFFSIYRHAIIQDWAVFKGRSMHPPKDNVNAVLSFLYTLILYRVDTALEIEQLDSYCGYLHSLGYGKRSLAYDMMEEYRTPIADTLTAALFNLGILAPEDFEESRFIPQSDEYPMEQDSVIIEETTGVLLNKKGLVKVITQFEKKLETEIYYTPLLRKITYKQLINEQAKQFRKYLTGEISEYIPLVIK